MIKLRGEARPNNGMHQTRISADVIRKVGCLSHNLRAGDAGRYVSASR